MLRGYRCACTHGYDWLCVHRYMQRCAETCSLTPIYTQTLLVRATDIHVHAQTCCTHTLTDARSQTSVLTPHTDTRAEVLTTHGVSAFTRGCPHMHTQGGMCSKEKGLFRGHWLLTLQFLGSLGSFGSRLSPDLCMYVWRGTVRV